jgi:glycosyltransferase involved in cell wall biosynthesis
MTHLRILQIAHDHPEWTTGGTEFVAQDLTRSLGAMPGVTARFLTAATRLHRPEAQPGDLQALGQDFVLVTGAYDSFTMLRQDGLAWRDGLARVLATVKPDIVHLHSLDRLGAEIVPAIRHLAPSARIVLTLHDYQVICAAEGLLRTTEGALCPGASPDRCRRCLPEIPASRHALRKAHLGAVLSQVDRVIAPSRFLRDKMLEWGVAPEKLVVIRNGVTAVPATFRRARQRNRFAFFGNIARHKGCLVLLQAAARLARDGADLHISLHGGLGWNDSAFRREFSDLLQAAQPIAQHFGPYDRGAVGALMQQADWVVTPSLWVENAPLVILEAQAAQRPVICSGIGGMAELVRHGVDGLHVPPGDAARLADQLKRAAANTRLWKTLSSAATGRPLEAMVAEHVSLYRSLSQRVPA